MYISVEQAYWAAVRANLKMFLMQAFREIYPGKEFMDNWHIDAMVHCLECCIQGKMPRLIINLPPRYLKSFIVSVVFPAYLLGMDPTVKIICISYSDELAKALSRDFRRVIESDWYRAVFANVRFSKVTEGEITTSQGGGRFATSVGGTLTGRGGDFIIIDDPAKAADVDSETALKKCNDWFISTLLSRLDDKKLSVLIVVMQRLHIMDLSGFLQGRGFHKVSFAAIAIAREQIPIGLGKVYVREVGEALHGERESLETLQTAQDQYGPQTFAAQYQQRPEAPPGNLFKRKYLQLINTPPRFSGYGRYWVSIDTALSTSETADYSAITVGYSDEPGHCILFTDRGHWDYEMLLGKVLAYIDRFPDVTFVVEYAGSGISLYQYLCKRGIPTFYHTAKGDKVARAATVLPIFAEGRVTILNQGGKNSWVEPLISEMLMFPYGRFDDQVDSIVQALRWAEPRVNPGGRFYAY